MRKIIDVEKGTEAINKIVEIKDAILSGKTKNKTFILRIKNYYQ